MHLLETGNLYQGDFCMESGDINDNQSTALTIGLEFLGDGEMSFARRVSTEDGWDYLRMYIDGQQVAEWSGELDWDTESFGLTAGYQHDLLTSMRPKGWVCMIGVVKYGLLYVCQILNVMHGSIYIECC